MSRVDILLATYNGARFLPEQLASLAAQSHTDWRLLVRDDGSSDGSLEVVRAWAQTILQGVEIILDGRKGLGASQNFAALLEVSDAPYFACCDQDDVWLPHKLETMLAAAQAAEKAGAPVLAWSDLRVVDAELRLIAESFHRYSRRPALYPGRELRQVMLHNVVTGCASLGNAALREAALPVPPDAAMHDWWLAMVAAGLGALVRVEEATILYRQHGGNTLGANANDPLSQLRYVAGNAGEAMARSRRLLAMTQRQAGAFVARYGHALAAQDRAILTDYAGLAERGLAGRKAFFLRNRLLADNVLKNLPFFLLA